MDHPSRLCKAMDVVLDRNKSVLTAKELIARARARGAKVTQAQLSQFRKGIRPIQTDNLEVLIDAMEPEMRQEFYNELSASQLDPVSLITQASRESKAHFYAELLAHDPEFVEIIVDSVPIPDVLDRVISRMREENKSTHNHTEPLRSHEAFGAQGTFSAMAS